MSLIDLVHQQLGPDGIAKISERLGVSPSAAQSAVEAAVPLMVGGMAAHAQQPSGAQAVQSAADAHAGSGGLVSTAEGLLGGSGGSSLGGLLSSVLGQHQATVQDGVQQASGLDGAKVQQLMAMLAPLVMGAISQHQSSSGQSGGAPSGQGIRGLLKEAAQAAAGQGGGSSALGGILGKMLGGAS